MASPIAGRIHGYNMKVTFKPGAQVSLINESDSPFIHSKIKSLHTKPRKSSSLINVLENICDEPHQPNEN